MAKLIKKKRGGAAGESLEPAIWVDFRKPWFMIITLAIGALILAAIYCLMG